MTGLLTDEVAVVTGAASGNGREIARTFAEHGADVVVADIREDPREGGEPTAAVIEAETDGSATFVECNVADRDDLEAAADAADDLGGLSVMVNNAGIFRGEEFLEVTEDELQEFLDVNVKGVFFGSQVAARRMLDDGTEGSIINMSSIGALRAKDAYPSYDLTKGAVMSLTYSLADRFGPEGIRVNTIMPGLIETAMTSEDITLAGTDFGEAYAEENVPMGRFGQPDEVGKAAVFLASDLASYVNGEALVVDGGVANTN